MYRSAPDWSDDVFRVLRGLDVRQVAVVPDAGLSRLIAQCDEDDDVRLVRLTTEEEGIAHLAGAWLGGERGALLMQSSGVGNCVNLFSLLQNGRFPFVTLVSMRGEYGEANPWQVPMGRGVQPVMEAMGLTCLRAERDEEVVPAARAALTMAYKSDLAVGVLLTQRLIGAKAF